MNGWLSFDVVKDMLRYDLVREADRIRAKTLLITGDKDISSTVYNNSKLFAGLACEKQFKILSDCEHLFTKPQNAQDLYQTVFEWVKENV